MDKYFSRSQRLILFGCVLCLLLAEGCSCYECSYVFTSTYVDGQGQVVVVEYKSCDDSYRDFWTYLIRIFGTGTDAETGKAHGVARSAAQPVPAGGLRGDGVTAPLRCTLDDGAGGMYAGGVFLEALLRDGPSTEVSNVALWDPSGRNGRGEWDNLEGGLDGPVNALARSGADVYVAGAFGSSVQEGTPTPRIARWDPAGRVWSPVGQGVRGGSFAEIQAMTTDASDRVVVGGDFTTVVNPDGTEVPSGGVARWNPTSETWTALGEGFQTRLFETILPLDGDSVLVSGQFVLPGQSDVIPVMLWDGLSWSPYDDGLEAEFGAYELSRDGGGSLYLRYYYYDQNNYENSGFRIAERSAASTSWQTILHNESIVSSVAHPNGVGVAVNGDFTAIEGSPTNGRALWDGTAWDPVPTPGACAQSQLLHTMAEPSLPPVDVVVDGDRISEQLTFGSATSMMSVEPGSEIDAAIVLSSGFGKLLQRLGFSTPGDTLFAVREVVAEDRSCIIAGVGLSSVSGFSSNPEDRSTLYSFSSVDIPNVAGKSANDVHVVFLHAVTDAPTVQIELDGVVVVEGLGFGEFSIPSLASDAQHTISITATDSGVDLGTYEIDLAGDGGGTRTIALTGFIDSAENQGGPPFAVRSFGSDGSSHVVPTHTEQDHVIDATGVRSVYPNPAGDHVTVRYEVDAGSGAPRLVVVDAIGREVIVAADILSRSGSFETVMDVSGLAQGNYFVRLTAGSHSSTRPFAVVR